MEYASIASAAGVGAALLAGCYWMSRTAGEDDNPLAADDPAGRSPRRVRPAGIPEDAMPALSGAQLLARPQYASLVHSILNKTGLSQENNAQDALPVLHAYALFVQLLPASEAHHHAHPGGLLQHTLEVIDYALSYRRAYMLPIGAAPEKVNELRHVWSFGTLLAAAFHDVGKPMSDLSIRMYGANIPREGKLWQPMAGHMMEQGASHYQVQFNEQRAYADHQSLSLVLMQRMVPTAAMSWISGADSALLRELMDMLAGKPSDNSILLTIVKKADMESTRLNLQSGPRTRFKTSRETPLVEVLDEALCRLLNSGNLKLNQPGGHGFVWGGDQGQGDLILVCPRIVDEMRTYLKEALSDGSRGIPTDNLILYGTWMDYSRVRPLLMEPKAGSMNSTARAVWRVRIEGIATPLTVLRFPKESLTLRDMGDLPPAHTGKIEALDFGQAEPVEAPAAAPAAFGATAQTAQPVHAAQALATRDVGPAVATPAAPAAHAAEPELDGLDALMAMSNVVHQTPPSVASVPAPAQSINLYALRAEQEGREANLREANIASQGLVLDAPVTTVTSHLDLADTPGAKAPSTAATSARAWQPPKKSVPSMQIRSQTSASSLALLQKFEEWLRAGLQSAHLHYNGAKAMVHFYEMPGAHAQDVAKTVCLLVTPAIYQRFVKESDPEKYQAITSLADIPRSAWLPVQTALLANHEHKQEREGTIRRSVFRFATKAGGMFGANVLTNPKLLLGQVPEINPHIVGKINESALGNVPTSPVNKMKPLANSSSANSPA